MPSRYHLVTLGCPKNAVDSDKIAAALGADGLTSTDDVGAADLVVIEIVEPSHTQAIGLVLSDREPLSPMSGALVSSVADVDFERDLADGL